MMDADNDTHENFETWSTLAAPTARALIRLGFYKQEVANRHSKAHAGDAGRNRTADSDSNTLKEGPVTIGIHDLDEPTRIRVKRI